MSAIMPGTLWTVREGAERHAGMTVFILDLDDASAYGVSNHGHRYTINNSDLRPPTPAEAIAFIEKAPGIVLQHAVNPPPFPPQHASQPSPAQAMPDLMKMIGPLAGAARRMFEPPTAADLFLQIALPACIHACAEADAVTDMDVVVEHAQKAAKSIARAYETMCLEQAAKAP